MMKRVVLLLAIIAISLSRKRRGVHRRYPYVDGPAIGPEKVKVYNDVPLKAPPGSVEHQTSYWHEEDSPKIKENDSEPYYDGGYDASRSLPSYSVKYGMGGQRKALFPRVRGLRYYSRFSKQKKNRRHHLRKH